MVGHPPGYQSSIFTGSFSEGPGAAGWDEIQDGFSSPRITFSHWLRLFLGQTTSDTCCLLGSWTAPQRGPHPPAARLRTRALGAVLTDGNSLARPGRLPFASLTGHHSSVSPEEPEAT